MNKPTAREIILLMVSLILLVLYVVASLPRDMRLNSCVKDYNSLVAEINNNCVCSKTQTDKGDKEIIYFIHGINGSGEYDG